MQIARLVVFASSASILSWSCKPRRTTSEAADISLRDVGSDKTYVAYSEGEGDTKVAILMTCDLKAVKGSPRILDRYTCPPIRDKTVTMPYKKYMEKISNLLDYRDTSTDKRNLALLTNDSENLRKQQVERKQQADQDRTFLGQIEKIEDQKAVLSSRIEIMKARKILLDKIESDLYKLGLSPGDLPVLDTDKVEAAPGKWKAESLLTVLIDGFKGQQTDGERHLEDVAIAAAQAAYQAWAESTEWLLVAPHTFSKVSLECGKWEGRLAFDFELKGLQAQDPEKFAKLGIPATEKLWTSEHRLEEGVKLFAIGANLSEGDAWKAADNWMGTGSYVKTVRLSDGVAEELKLYANNPNLAKFGGVCVKGENLTTPSSSNDMTSYLKWQEDTVMYGVSFGWYDGGNLNYIARCVSLSHDGVVPRNKGEQLCTKQAIEKLGLWTGTRQKLDRLGVDEGKQRAYWYPHRAGKDLTK